MRRIPLLLAFSLLICFGFQNLAASDFSSVTQTPQLQVVERQASGLTVQFDLNDEKVSPLGTEPLTYAMTTTAEGREVPSITRLVQVPAGHRAQVSVIRRQAALCSVEAVNLNLEAEAIDAQQLKTFKLDPPEPVSGGVAVEMRGRLLTPLTVYPYQIDVENEDRLVENTNIEFEISFVPDPSAAKVIPVNDPPGSDMAVFFDRLALNGPGRDNPLRDDPVYAETQQPNRGRMLILHQVDQMYNQQGAPLVAELANWKRLMGYEVEVLGVNLAQGITPLEIRNNIIRPRYFDVDNPLAYVILVGGDLQNQNLSFPSFRQGGGDGALIGDHYFTLMDDENIFLSDIAIGRLQVQSFQELAGVVTRQILYEREPFTEDGTDWFNHALVTAEDIAVQGGGFVPSMRHLGRWIWRQFVDYGFEPIDTLYSTGEDVNIDDEVRDALTEGCSIAFSRGWVAGVTNRAITEVLVDTGPRHPFTLAVTCLSFQTHDLFFRTTTRNHPTGPIVDCAMTALTHSKSNNSLLGGSVLAMTDLDIPQAGLIQNYSKVQLYSDNRYELANYIEENIAVYRMMGDPSTQIFWKVPCEIEVLIPDSVSRSSTGISVQVTLEGIPVLDAWVTIMQGDDLHWVCQPGEDGWARFTVEGLSDEHIQVCVTRPNTAPFVGVIPVRGNGLSMDVAFANQDGLFSFGETVRTNLTFQNNTGQAVNNAVARLSSDYPFVTLPAEIAVGNLAAGAQRALPFDLVINRPAQGGDQVRAQVDVVVGQATYEHSFSFPVSGPNLAVINNPIVDHSFNPDQLAEFAPLIYNNGDLASPAYDATLEALSPYIQVVENSARYSAVNAQNNQVPQTEFQVRASALAIPGDIASFRLILDAVDQQDAFADTLYFDVMIGDPSNTDPFGPDDYGYIIFDSGDEGWEKCPDYEWIEINPFIQGFDFNGVELDLPDEGNNMDCSVVTELPFTFQFYGEDFDDLTVCSNGWLAFGAENAIFPDFRNQQIPGIQGPNAMVAVLWDDFINPFPDERGVFTYYDEETGRFIVEWSKWKIFRDGQEGDVHANLFEFQAILYEPASYPTSTGDGEIKIQYKKVFEIQGDGTDNFYNTIGIKNLEGTDGLEYCYWNHYPANNLRLGDEMALLITTDRISTAGRLEGRITDAANQNQGLANAQVRSLRTNVRAVADAQGNYVIDPIPAGEQQIEFSLDGYNTLVSVVTIENEQTARLNASLTHPELALPRRSIEKSLRQDFATGFSFRVENRGNGPLEYKFHRRYRNGEDTEYSQTASWDASSITDSDFFFYGCEIVGTEIFASGGRDRRDYEDNTIYVFGQDSNLVRSFLQPSTATGTGFRDLAYDGEYLYGGQVNGNVLQMVAFDLQGNLQRVIDLELSTADLSDVWALAFDPAEEVFYVGNSDKDIFVLNRDGQVVRQISVEIDHFVMNLRGMAWFPEDNERMSLYLMDLPGLSGIRLSKVHPESGEGRILNTFEMRDSEKPIGLSIGYDWAQSVVSLAFIGDVGAQTPDFVHVLEMGPDTHYMTIDPIEASVPAGAALNSHIFMDASTLHNGDYYFGLLLEHNAAGGDIIIPGHLSVNDTTAVDFGEETAPENFELSAAYPNPFNGVTSIEFAVPAAGQVKLSVYDVSGRLVQDLLSNRLEAGRHEVTFNAAHLSSGIYFYRLEAAGKFAVRRMVYMK